MVSNGLCFPHLVVCMLLIVPELSIFVCCRFEVKIALITLSQTSYCFPMKYTYWHWLFYIGWQILLKATRAVARIKTASWQSLQRVHFKCKHALLVILVISHFSPHAKLCSVQHNFVTTCGMSVSCAKIWIGSPFLWTVGERESRLMCVVGPDAWRVTATDTLKLPSVSQTLSHSTSMVGTSVTAYIKMHAWDTHTQIEKAYYETKGSLIMQT